MCCSQQFRSRDCKNIDIFLYCATQPAIESCYDLTFGCYSANYNGLEGKIRNIYLMIRIINILMFPNDRAIQKSKSKCSE